MILLKYFSRSFLQIFGIQKYQTAVVNLDTASEKMKIYFVVCGKFLLDSLCWRSFEIDRDCSGELYFLFCCNNVKVLKFVFLKIYFEIVLSN